MQGDALPLRMQCPPLFEFDLQVYQLFQPLLDLVEQIGARTTLVLIPQFEDHCAESSNRTNRMVRVIFANNGRISRCKSGFFVAWHREPPSIMSNR